MPGVLLGTLRGCLGRRRRPLGLCLVLLVLIFLLSYRSRSITGYLLNPQDAKNSEPALKLYSSPLHLSDKYEHARLSILEKKGFRPLTGAQRVRAPDTLPSGRFTYSPSLEVYIADLEKFVDVYLSHAPSKLLEDIQFSLDCVSQHRLFEAALPTKIWSTHPRGKDGVDQSFHLWSQTLPLPWSVRLKAYFDGSPTVNLSGVEERQEWNVDVVGDSRLQAWINDRLGRSNGVLRNSKWTDMWNKLSHGVMKADVFRYVALLTEGGVYADSDTAPIAHPYLWGMDGEDILDGRMKKLLALKSPAFSILDPTVNLVVAIEWDRYVAFDLTRFYEWDLGRFRKSYQDCCYARSLQMAQYLMMAKPHHPVMLDTLHMIAEAVEAGQVSQKSIIDLTGPGPFTDAVFRYLLIRYGVTPDDLRSIRHSVRIGDVIILREEAFLAPAGSALVAMADHVKDLNLDKESTMGKNPDPWLWGMGYWSWRSGGWTVASHWLQGSWKGNI